MLPVEFNYECEGTDFEEANLPTLGILDKMRQFLSIHNIPVPPICDVQNMTVEQRNGWGDFVDSEYLSIIIKLS